LGKLGFPLAMALQEASFSVTGYDADPAKGFIGLPTVKSMEELVRDTDCCFFVVPTPSKPDGSFDHSMLAKAMEEARFSLGTHQPDYTFIVTSTVMPGFLEYVKSAYPHVVYKPEFIALGTVTRDLTHPPMVLIGECCQPAGDLVEGIYRRVVANHAPVKRMSLVEAELTKISVNCGVTMKISFANQIGMLAERLGADPHRVLDAVGSDPRIGERCLGYGLPYGGPCFPRDNRMLARVADLQGMVAELAEATHRINLTIKWDIASKIDQAHPRKVGILGLTYKPGVPIVEESLGTWLLSRCEDLYPCLAHDPIVPSPNTLDEVLACPVIVVCCAHPEYRNLRIPAGTTLIDPMCVVLR
jgi:UDPglucose 6-dehydrogenase